MSDPSTSDEGEDVSPFGATGDNIETVEYRPRVSREMKLKLEAAKVEGGYKNMNNLAEDLLTDNLTDINNMVSGIKQLINLANQYEKKMLDRDDSVSSFQYQNGIARFGSMQHRMKFDVEERYSGSVSSICTAIDCDASTVIRMCFIKGLRDMAEEDDIEFGPTHRRDIILKWLEIQNWIGDFKSEFCKFMGNRFVFSIESSKMSFAMNSSEIPYIKERYEQAKDSDSFEDVVDFIGREPFDNLEKLIEEYEPEEEII